MARFRCSLALSVGLLACGSSVSGPEPSGGSSSDGSTGASSGAGTSGGSGAAPGATTGANGSGASSGVSSGSGAGGSGAGSTSSGVATSSGAGGAPSGTSTAASTGAGGGPVPSDTCGECAEDSIERPCEPAYDACLDDFACWQLLDCHGDCEWTFECHQQCSSIIPSGEPAFAALMACVMCTHCDWQCDESWTSNVYCGD